MIARMLAVAEVTIRRLMRSRLLWIGVAGSILITAMLMSTMVNMVRFSSNGQLEGPTAVTHAAGNIVALLGAFATLVAYFIGVTVVRRDVVDGTVASVLSKPVSRGEYIVASYIGAALFLFALWAVFAVVLAVFSAGFKSPLPGSAYTDMLGRCLVCVMTMAIAMAMSIRIHPWVAVVLTGLLLRGRDSVNALADVLKLFGVRMPGSVAEALKFPFPMRDALNGLGSGLNEGALVERSIAAGVFHIIDYGLVMVLCAYLLFRTLEVNRVRE
ncbi:MAG TPA: ABC transporter permease subunit [Candidatus Krumholzibacteria bacterium]|nr:ABC transporter permease subunit [Candidatus Krumholzibacteria bacterium]